MIGQVVRAEQARRWNGDIWLVVMLPDGYPGRVRVSETELASDPEPDEVTVATVSMEGLRALRGPIVRLKGRLATGDAQ